MRRSRLALALCAVTLSVTGCLEQPEEANNNGPQEQPERPGGVVRTPAPVEEAPIVVDPPGPTRSP